MAINYTCTPERVKLDDMPRFDDYKFHPSTIVALMTEPRSKADIEAGLLSETTKTYLQELWVEYVFGRSKEFNNKFVEKGNANEVLARSMVAERLDIHYITGNKQTLSNDFVIGTPDIILEDRVIDIKCSWDIFSFAKADGYNDTYYMQLQCYMWLTGKTKAQLAYCLTDTPEFIITNEKNRMFYKFDTNEQGQADFQMWEQKFEKLCNYNDIKSHAKVKIFTYEYNEGVIEKLKINIVKAREHMNSLSL